MNSNRDSENNVNELNNQSTAHTFELAGMGTGPYRFVGMVSLPAPSLAEANPQAYANASRDCADAAKGVSGGLGICRHCGRPIMNNCIVQDSSGTRYAVGVDCVERTGDASIGDPAKVAAAKALREANRAKRQAKREADRQRWLDATCSTGETNRERLARESREAQARVDARAEAARKRGEILDPLATVIEDGRGGFRDSVANDMKGGSLPMGRGFTIAQDIYGSAHGRRNSKAYAEAIKTFDEVVAKAEEVAQ